MKENIVQNVDIKTAYNEVKLSVIPDMNLPKMINFQDTFDEISIHPALLQRLKQLQYDTLTLAQEISIPYVMKGQNVIMNAQTGSGKTMAFLIPFLNNILFKKHGTPILGTPTALILTPTRELALQIHKEFVKLSHDFRVKGIPL